MLSDKYSCIEDLLMISQSWKTTDIKEIELMLQTFNEVIHVVHIWSENLFQNNFLITFKI